MSVPRPCTVVFIRHAESLANMTLSQITQGLATSFPAELASLRDADVQLTERGVAQARATGPWLAAQFETFDHCYVSPWMRTRQTFEYLLEGYPPDTRARLLRRVAYEERLREHEPGALLWVAPAEVEARFPVEAHRRALEGEYYYRPLGGESWADVTLRLSSVLATIYRDHPGGRVLVVTHSTAILCFRKLLQRLDEAQILAVRKAGNARNASISVFTHSPVDETIDMKSGQAGADAATPADEPPLDHWHMDLWDHVAYGPELASVVPDVQQRVAHPDAPRG